MIILFVGVDLQANKDHALYSDAQLLRVERQLHDTDSCTCAFLVRFEYDNAEVNKINFTYCRKGISTHLNFISYLVYGYALFSFF